MIENIIFYIYNTLNFFLYYFCKSLRDFINLFYVDDTFNTVYIVRVQVDH